MRLAFVWLLLLTLTQVCHGQSPEELMARLKDADAGNRAGAAWVLGAKKVEAAIPALSELLTDKNQSVRGAAAVALSRIGPKCVPALTAALKEPPESQLEALKALARIGPPAKDAVPVIAGVLADGPKLIRIQAAVTLTRIGPEAKAALPALFKAATDASSLEPGTVAEFKSVGEAAIWAALRIDPNCGEKLAKAALPDLITALKKATRPTALFETQEDLVAAADAILRLARHAKDAIPALNAAQKVAEFEAEEAVARAQLAIGGDAFKAFADTVKDPGAPLEKRRHLLEVIGTYPKGDAEIIALLSLALKDPKREIRQYAVDAAGFIGPEANAVMPQLIDLLGDKELDSVVFALGELGSDAAAPLAAVLADKKKSVSVRGKAAKALTDLGRQARSVLPALEAAMQDDDLTLAIRSAAAFVRAGGEPAKAIPILSKALKSGEKELVRNVFDVVVTLGHAAKALVPELQELLKNQDRGVRTGAIMAMVSIDPAAKPLVPAVAELLKDPDHRPRYGIYQLVPHLGADATELLPTLIDQLKVLEKPDPTRLYLDGDSGGDPVLDAIGGMGAGAKDAVPALAERLKAEKDDALAGLIAETLGRIGTSAKDAVPELIAYLGRAKGRSRAKAAKALGQIGPDAKDAVAKVKKVLTDRDTQNQVWATFALARITNEPKLYVDVLIDDWKSDQEARSVDRSIAIAEALELLGADALPARNILLEAVVDQETLYTARPHAARAVGHFASEAETIVPKLISLIERPEKNRFIRRDNCRVACIALSELGPKAKAALPALRKLLDEDDNAIVDSAAEVIEKIDLK